jgi:hypothetical protein
MPRRGGAAVEARDHAARERPVDVQAPQAAAGELDPRRPARHGHLEAEDLEELVVAAVDDHEVDRTLAQQLLELERDVAVGDPALPGVDHLDWSVGGRRQRPLDLCGEGVEGADAVALGGRAAQHDHPQAGGLDRGGPPPAAPALQVARARERLLDGGLDQLEGLVGEGRLDPITGDPAPQAEAELGQAEGEAGDERAEHRAGGEGGGHARGIPRQRRRARRGRRPCSRLRAGGPSEPERRGDGHSEETAPRALAARPRTA